MSEEVKKLLLREYQVDEAFEREGGFLYSEDHAEEVAEEICLIVRQEMVEWIDSRGILGNTGTHHGQEWQELKRKWGVK